MSLLDEFRMMGLDKIEEFIETKQEENLWLDFKNVNDPRLTHSDDKKNLGKALSGFANSDGGLVVWGIDARKNSNGVDCAVGKNEIGDVDLFVSRLNELTGEAVQPIVEGVLHKKISSQGSKGIAVTFIPPSDSGPHMAKFSEDRYYKRSGASFYKMEHFDIEDMFGRRKKPKLSLHGRVVQLSRMTIVLALENTGRGTAKGPYLAIKIPSPFRLAEWGLDGNGHDGLPKLHYAAGYEKACFGASSDFVIHPGTSLDVTAIDLGYPPHPPFAGKEISIEFEIAAEEFPLNKGFITVKW